jgi:hypothetical protein
MKLSDAVKFAQMYAKPDRARQFANHMIPHVVRPAQIIWNKALGALFGVLAILGFHHASLHKDNPAAVIMACFFGSVMAVFCIGSFLRVRRLSRLQSPLK